MDIDKKSDAICERTVVMQGAFILVAGALCGGATWAALQHLTSDAAPIGAMVGTFVATAAMVLTYEKFAASAGRKIRKLVAQKEAMRKQKTAEPT